MSLISKVRLVGNTVCGIALLGISIITFNEVPWYYSLITGCISGTSLMMALEIILFYKEFPDGITKEMREQLRGDK